MQSPPHWRALRVLSGSRFVSAASVLGPLGRAASTTRRARSLQEPERPRRQRHGPSPTLGIQKREAQEQTVQQPGEPVGSPARHSTPALKYGTLGLCRLALTRKFVLPPHVSRSIGHDRHADEGKEDEHHSGDIHVSLPYFRYSASFSRCFVGVTCA